MTDTPSTALTVAPQRQMTAVTDVVPIFDTADFEHMTRIAKLMAAAPLVPKALKGSNELEAQANCFLVVNQARNWRMDPFAVAQCCSVVQGKLMYEGKLIAAVISSVAGVDLDYEYYGEEGKKTRGVVVSAMVDGKLKTIKGTVADWETTNDNWKKQPDIQLVYRGSRVWCRVWKPAIMLGVYTFDEMEEAAELRRDLPAPDAPAPDAPAPSSKRLTAGFGDEQVITTTGEVVDPDTGEVTDDKGPKPDPKPKAARKKAEPATPAADPKGSSASADDASTGSAAATPGQSATSEPPESGSQEPGQDHEADLQEGEELDQTLDGDQIPTDDFPGDKTVAAEPDKAATAETGENPFARFEELIAGTESWLSIKHGLKVLKGTDAWKEADEEARRMTHRDIWDRMLVLREESKDRTDIIEDPHLFRCWLDSDQAQDHDTLMGTWKTLVRQPFYAKMDEATKDALAGVVQARLEALKGK